MRKHSVLFTVLYMFTAVSAAVARHLDAKTPVVFSKEPVNALEHMQPCLIISGNFDAEQKIDPQTVSVKSDAAETEIDGILWTGSTEIQPAVAVLSDGALPNSHLTWIENAMRPQYCSTLYRQLAKVREYDERGERVPEALEKRILALVTLEFAREKFLEEHAPTVNER